MYAAAYDIATRLLVQASSFIEDMRHTHVCTHVCVCVCVCVFVGGCGLSSTSWM